MSLQVYDTVRHGPMKCHTMYVMILSRFRAMPNFVFVDTDALDIADPNSTEDACHMNLVYGPSRRELCVAQWQSSRPRNLKI